MATANDMVELWDAVKEYIIDNDISCEESICQNDNVIAAAYDLIVNMCRIVGYNEIEDGN